jgi:hypothetical protein
MSSENFPKPRLAEAQEISSPAAGIQQGEDPQARDLALVTLSVLRELDESFCASQKFLLARDGIGLEQETLRQIELRRKLQQLPASSSVELRAARQRVLHLGRVQLSLLTRARRFHRMLEHLLAGPGAGYSIPASRVQIAHVGTAGEESSSCRA